MRSPAMSSQGLTVWPVRVDNIRHVIVAHAGLSRRPLSSAPVPRPRIILRHRLEGGCCPFASGTPATRGAHNSETLVQQPDRQLLVRESVPSRIAESAFS